MSCPSSTHDFKTWGDYLFCRKCGDVLFPLAKPPRGGPQTAPSLPFVPAAAAAPEPTPEELEAAIVRLREAAGLGERHGAEDLLEQFEADRPRARVPAEFDDTLPDAGL